ncbi:hypothetical protein DSO57_1000455 [Entomophthora muscae]|uniref:Uncharacterized protein n=2 Tax=Entomophthora muscae TaxID=34485 RepID=A0ACC2TC79_9FUNG|nr:hypothetical protein DSO57_1030308 [Entomophthora muscae]KAJ9090603.1 hypothetical protein DSO57_1000455 [Entomophthora muscae]
MKLVVLVGVCLGQSLDILEGNSINPLAYLIAVSKVLKSENVAKLLDQFGASSPQRLSNVTYVRPIDVETLQQSLEFSYIPMCPEKQVLIHECICSQEYTSIGFARDSEYRASATVSYHKKTQQAVVSYKYTTGLRNWLSNLDFLLGPLEGAPKGVMVHRGMLQYYQSIHNQTMKRVVNILKTQEVKSIVVTGYSLGASIATLSVPFWAKFKQNYNVPITVISYAGARTGNLQAKLYYESLGIPIMRYTNRDDIIPMLPPRTLGYVHAGLEIHERRSAIPGRTELVVCSQDYEEDPKCSYGEPGLRSITRHFTPFNNFPILPPYCSLDAIANFNRPTRYEPNP